MAQLAEKLRGIAIIMEHRFYGTSGPKVKTFFVSFSLFDVVRSVLLIHNISKTNRTIPKKI
jgi:hypothetical protein